MFKTTPPPPVLYHQEETHYSFTGAWVGPRVGFDGCGKSSPSPGFHPWTVHLMTSRYTHHATSSHLRISNEMNYHWWNVYLGHAFTRMFRIWWVYVAALSQTVTQYVSSIKINSVRFEVLTAMSVNITMFSHVIPYSLRVIFRSFGGTSYIIFSVGLYYYEYVGRRFLRYADKLLPDYMTPYPRRLYY
jgi:hypothetical protein